MTEKKTFIKRLIYITILIFVCFLLQTSVFSNLELAGVTPNFLIIIVSTFGFMRGRKEGLFVGFFCGLLLDFFFGYYLGLFALVYMYVGYMNGFFKKIFFGDDIKLPLILIGSSDLIYGLLIYVCMFLFREQYSFGFYFFQVILPEIVYTIVVAIPVYFIILKMNQRLEKNEKRSTRRLVE